MKLFIDNSEDPNNSKDYKILIGALILNILFLVVLFIVFQK